MKKRFKRIHIFLVIAISLFVLALPIYLRCPQFSKTKVVPSNLSFETPNQDEGLPDQEKELKVYGPSTLFVMFLLGIHLFGQSSHFFPRSLALRQKTLVLRC